MSTGILGSGNLKLQIIETWENGKTMDMLQKICQKQGVLNTFSTKRVYVLCRYQRAGSMRSSKHKVKTRLDKRQK